MRKDDPFPAAQRMLLAAAMASFGPVAPAQDAEPARGGRLELVAPMTRPRWTTARRSHLEYNTVAGALYEGLYHFKPEGELEAASPMACPRSPRTASSTPSDIKPGAMFAGPDFEPRDVTAADVAYGMIRALDPTPDGAPAASWGSGYLFPIAGAAAFNVGEAESVAGIEVIDDHTLQVTLAEPTSTFVLGLTIATSWPVPQEAVEATWRGLRQQAGRRRALLRRRSGTRAPTSPWLRNPGYVDPELPYLDEIHVDLGRRREHPDAAPRVGPGRWRLRAVRAVAAVAARAAEVPTLTLAESVGPRIFYLALNNDGIFGNRDLRQAVAQAMTTRLHGPLRRAGQALEPAHELDLGAVGPRRAPLPMLTTRSGCGECCWSRPATTARPSRSSTT